MERIVYFYLGTWQKRNTMLLGLKSLRIEITTLISVL